MIKENGGTVITCFVDKNGAKHTLPIYLTAADAAATYATNAVLATKANQTALVDTAAALRNNLSYGLSLKADKTNVGYAATNYYYVSRRVGTSLSQQNSEAIRGNSTYTFSNPHAALRAAVADLKSGLIQNAVIRILAGTYSAGAIGSGSDYESNFTFTKQNRYDTYNSDSTNTESISLLYNNVFYVVDEGVTVTNNSKSQFSCLFSDGNTSIVSSYEGGNYVGKFGQANGFSGNYDFMLLGLSSNVKLKFDNFDSKCGGGSAINIRSHVFDFKANYVKSADKYFVKIQNTVIDSAYYNIEIGDLRTGKYAGSEYVIVNDAWTTFYTQTKANTYVRIKIKNAFTHRTQGIFNLNWSAGKTDIFVDNIESTVDNSLSNSQGILHMSSGHWGLNLTAKFGNVLTNGRLANLELSNKWNYSNVILDCGNVVSTDTTQSLISIRTDGDTLSNLTIKGNYVSQMQCVNLQNNSAVSATVNILANLKSYRAAAISVSGNVAAAKIAGNLSSNSAAVSGTGTITFLPSSSSNVDAASTVTKQGVLTVAPYYKF